MKKVVDEPWPLYLVSFFLITSTYFGMYRPIQAQRENFTLLEQQSLERTRMYDEAMRNSKKYNGAADEARRALGSLHLDDSESQKIAYLLVDLDEAAHSRKIYFGGLESQPTLNQPATPAFVLHARGHYDDLLHFIADLAFMRTLLSVQSLDFVRDSSTVHSGQAPYLDASIRIQLMVASSKATNQHEHTPPLRSPLGEPS